MKKIYIILSIIIFIVIIFVVPINEKNKEKYFYNEAIQDKLEKEKNEKKIDDIEEIQKIKNEINSEADANIYQIEDDAGRKFLQIKPNIQFEVDLAGILKNAKPEESEINELLKGRPIKKGIWISKQSRDKFLQILKNNSIENFYITNEGILKTKIQQPMNNNF